MASSNAQQNAAKPALRKPVFVKVDQLKPGTNGHTLIVKVLNANAVLQKGKSVSQHLRQTRISECLVGDETASILFAARNDQVICVRTFKMDEDYILKYNYHGGALCIAEIDLMEPGATVILRNAKIDMFKGSMRLAVDKWGRIELTEPASFVVKEDNNLSLIEYELVNVAED
ncbi:unnamed protein product [Camellia sinensis]